MGRTYPDLKPRGERKLFRRDSLKGLVEKRPHCLQERCRLCNHTRTMSAKIAAMRGPT